MNLNPGMVKWEDCQTIDGQKHELYVDYSVFNGFLDGCEVRLGIDDAIEDVLIYDYLNVTWVNLNKKYIDLDNDQIYAGVS